MIFALCLTGFEILNSAIKPWEEVEKREGEVAGNVIFIF